MDLNIFLDLSTKLTTLLWLSVFTWSYKIQWVMILQLVHDLLLFYLDMIPKRVFLIDEF